MSGRDEVLAAVRAALAPTRSAPPHPVADDRDGASDGLTPAPAGPPRVPTRSGLVDLFAERVADYRATVTRTDLAGLEDTVRAVLGGAERVVVPDGLWLDLPRTLPDHGLSHAQLDAADAVVTGATLGIAETGTIVLTHGPGQGRRALTLVPDHHVCVVTADQVVPDVPQAVAALDPHLPQTWISGPSATSDIELDRVEGVHGPRRLDVVLVDGRVS
jgi:L-lactate dehydrogenase complex protein LldG